MKTDNDHRPEGDPDARPDHRSRRVVIGTIGLATVLGAGAYGATAHLTSEPGQKSAVEIQAVAPVPGQSPDVAATASASAQPLPSVDTRGEAVAPEVVKEILEARRKMAKDGIAVKPALPQKSGAPSEDVKRVTKGSLKSGGIIRIVTAESDLTGQGELAAVAGGITKYRNVPCSQTFRFSSSPEPKRKDNLLMCWRTTATRSVVAIVVDPDGKPSREKAVTALEKKWRSMD